MIKKWKTFIESVGGWELVGKHTMGVNYGEENLPNTLSTKDQSYLISIDGNFYNEADFMNLYDTLLKSIKLDPNMKVFNQDNLDSLVKIVMDNEL